MHRSVAGRTTWLFSIVLIGGLAAGCGARDTRGVVSGAVTFDGQPVEDGSILFEPEGGQGQTAGAAIKEGKFTAEVPLGKMRVRIHGNKKTGRKYKVYDTPESPLVEEIVELLPPKYNVNSELTLEVKPGAQQVQYDLKSR